jgi:hypothetical protein
MSIQRTAAPTAFGFVSPRAYFSVTGRPQAIADQDARSGIKIVGCALYNSYLTASNSQTVAGNPMGAFNSGSNLGRAYSPLSPNNIDPRLTALVQCYQYYAFRRLKVYYIPMCGSSQVASSTVVGSNAIIYLAIGKDYEADAAAFSAVGVASPSVGTVQNLMETDPSASSSVWQPLGLEFTHKGTKLWETFPNSEETFDARIQAALLGIVEGGGITALAGLVQFGRLWIEYEVDLYTPGPPLGSN